MNPASYHNVQEEWVPELKSCMPHVPYILIGTQVQEFLIQAVMCFFIIIDNNNNFVVYILLLDQIIIIHL